MTRFRARPLTIPPVTVPFAGGAGGVFLPTIIGGFGGVGTFSVFEFGGWEVIELLAAVRFRFIVSVFAVELAESVLLKFGVGVSVGEGFGVGVGEGFGVGVRFALSLKFALALAL